MPSPSFQVLFILLVATFTATISGHEFMKRQTDEKAQGLMEWSRGHFTYLHPTLNIRASSTGGYGVFVASVPGYEDGIQEGAIMLCSNFSGISGDTLGPSVGIHDEVANAIRHHVSSALNLAAGTADFFLTSIALLFVEQRRLLVQQHGLGEWIPDDTVNIAATVDWTPYVAMLPGLDEFIFPPLFEDESIAILDECCPDEAEYLRGTKDLIEHGHRILDVTLFNRNENVFCPEVFCREGWLWAMGNTISRAFSPGAKMHAFKDMFNHDFDLERKLEEGVKIVQQDYHPRSDDERCFNFLSDYRPSDEVYILYDKLTPQQSMTRYGFYPKKKMGVKKSVHRIQIDPSLLSRPLPHQNVFYSLLYTRHENKLIELRRWACAMGDIFQELQRSGYFDADMFYITYTSRNTTPESSDEGTGLEMEPLSSQGNGLKVSRWLEILWILQATCHGDAPKHHQSCEDEEGHIGHYQPGPAEPGPGLESNDPYGDHEEHDWCCGYLDYSTGYHGGDDRDGHVRRNAWGGLTGPMTSSPSHLIARSMLHLRHRTNRREICQCRSDRDKPSHTPTGRPFETAFLRSYAFHWGCE